MVDYEITVNVSNLTHEEKKRVQDAFFKLGFSWWDGTNYSCLNKKCYTNKFKGGKVTQDLMWADASMKSTHTVDQLLELAGMKKQNTTRFSLERALAGEPVVTRNGKEVTQLTLFETRSKYVLAGVVGGNIISFTKEGTYLFEGDSHEHDLFMKVKTHTVNGFEVPKPTTEQPKKGSHYYLPNPVANSWFNAATWNGGGTDLMRLNQRNLVFSNKEDAIANAKAMLGVDPYGEDNE